ncbi:sodium/amino acid symporter [Gordonia araii NBRC 100433]|uniref:Sodium/amino acid symporter n=1 Tax=Gordonia araii NBRC 100433 TaxID=1073574 RepID=G7H3P5_9ACTN|nr:alanine/glycine:cation symporter family protein [Gordonia araii]NNG96584.1 alanine:cation symporter family protein [Gordonia araii NBRC 100433]GAB10470.1 sodium/amino acid symporter [Gordonia araii NBRC 100433]
MSNLLDAINGVIWSNALIYLCLVVGVYFSVRTRFVQLRRVGDMVRLIRRGASSESGVSSFQALAISLAGRIGAGNIVGVATAIAFGGPGALFWMWAMAFLGASTSFVECTLGQIYKTKDPLTGEYRGGPAFYLRQALAHTRASTAFKVYGWVFALVTAIACGVLMPNIQSNSIAESMNNAWGVEKWVIGAVTMLLLAFVIVGGVKRIATFAAYVVPFMAIAYIGLALLVVAVNVDQVPAIIRLVFASAFGADAAFGAILGSAIMWGVKRGIYSNEAGQGTGPHAAAAAEVSHPAKQGLVQAFAVYIDTLFVCSATGFLILATGSYRVFDGEKESGGVRADGGGLPAHVPGTEEVGAKYAQVGFDTLWSGAGASFIAISLGFFCFTTIVAYYYMADTNLRFMLGDTAKIYVRPLRSTVGANVTLLLQAVILGSVLFGAVSTAKDAWALGDIGVGTMAWLNLIGILILQRPAFKALRDYEEQRKRGIDPVFDPRKLGIVGATFWETYEGPPKPHLTEVPVRR